jgi:hypothetical protein
MESTQPTLEQWRHLFELAGQVYKLKPWEWMAEEDIFGVEDPHTDEWGFISVLGEGGEYFAVNICKGSEGLYEYLDFMDGEMTNPLQLTQIPLVHVSFTRRADLEKEDIALLKKLKIKAADANGWISFRAHRYGFIPWYLEADDVSVVESSLEQLLEVAVRCKTEETLLYPVLEDSEDQDDFYDNPVKLFFRVPQKEGSTILWKDEVREVPFPEPPKLNLFLGIQNLETVKKLPRYKNGIELDIFMLPTPMDEDSSRPYFPFMLMAVDERKAEVVFSHLMRPLPTVQSMYESVPLQLLSAFMQLGKMPSKFIIRSPITELLLTPFVGPLKIKVEMQDELPAFDTAAMGLLQFLMADEMDMFGEDDDFLFMDER